jgi:hypothetical protein
MDQQQKRSDDPLKKMCPAGQMVPQGFSYASIKTISIDHNHLHRS